MLPKRALSYNLWLPETVILLNMSAPSFVIALVLSAILIPNAKEKELAPSLDSRAPITSVQATVCVQIPDPTLKEAPVILMRV